MERHGRSRNNKVAGHSGPAPLLGALAVVLAIAALPAAAFGKAGAVVKPGTMGPGPVNACFWGVPSSNVGPINEMNYPVAGQNVLAVDTDVVYYYTRMQLPAGATVTLHGQFPHSRFFSLTSYVTRGTEAACRRRRSMTRRSTPTPARSTHTGPAKTAGPRTARTRSR